MIYCVRRKDSSLERSALIVLFYIIYLNGNKITRGAREKFYGVRRLDVAFIRLKMRTTLKAFRANNVRTIILRFIINYCSRRYRREYRFSKFSSELVMKATSSRRTPNYFRFRQYSSPAAPRIIRTQVDGSGTPDASPPPP